MLAFLKAALYYKAMQFFNRITKSLNPQEISQILTQEFPRAMDLGILFISTANPQEAIHVIESLQRKIQFRHLIGCSCAGIVGQNEEIEGRPSSSLLAGQLPGVTITPFKMNQTQLESLQMKEDWYQFFEIYPNEHPTFIALPDPFMFDMNGFLQGLNEAYPQCAVVGGIASGASRPGGNTLIYNQERLTEGVVGVVLQGNLRLETVVSQGCKPIGETFIVTKAEENVIYTLAGRPFVKVLEEVLDKASPADRMLAQEAVFVGIAIDEYKHQLKRGDFLVRGVMGIDPESGAGAIVDYIKTGQTVQFHVRDAKSAREDLDELLLGQRSKTASQKPQGALVFCCNGRGQNLFHEENHDIKVIQQHLGPIPAAGFFCAGEIGPVGGSNFLHGFTNSIALFYDSTSSK